MALTVKQILRFTFPDIKERARRCRARRMAAKTLDDNKLGELLFERYRVQGTTDRYVVDLKYLPMTKNQPAVKDEDAPLWVSCDCGFFLYRCEVALARRGSSSIVYSNGKRPVHTNPRMVPYVCKHAIRAINTSITTDLHR